MISVLFFVCVSSKLEPCVFLLWCVSAAGEVMRPSGPEPVPRGRSRGIEGETKAGGEGNRLEFIGAKLQILG